MFSGPIIVTCFFVFQAMKLDVNSGETHKFTEDKLYCSGPEFVARPGAVVSNGCVLIHSS